MKILLLSFALSVLSMYAMGQQDPVLMRINNKEITRSEFEYSYNKNSIFKGTDSKSLHEYVDLFVNFKLKVAAAESAKIDTTRVFRDELASYRRQLAKSYLTDEVAEDEYANEVYEKMKKNSRAGQVLVAQIFKYLPQNASAKELRDAQLLMDSIYNVLVKDPQPDFEKYVSRYSDEKKRFWIGWLQTSEEFEKVVFSMDKGQLSKPFFTPKGLHIVKVLETRDIPPFKDVRNEILRRLTRQSGSDKGAEALVEKLKTEYHYISREENVQELYTYGKTDKVLFTINGRAYTGVDFEHFSEGHPQEIRKQLRRFVIKSMLDYENERLEIKYPDFRYLMQEYRDGILLFEISNREIWEPASNDEQGLKAFFKTHKENYFWKRPRYRGVVVHSVNKKIARKAKKLVRKLPYEQWFDIILKTFNKESIAEVKLEQGVFVEGSNKYVDKIIFKKGDFVPLEAFPYTVVIGEKVKGPDSYNDVRELLQVDYQEYLDFLWMEHLRAKGKVEINQEVLKTVNNH